MNKKYMMIPVALATVLIPQLVFLWLAPAVAARFTVYVGGTLLTVAVTAALFMIYWKFNLRKSIGLAAMSAIMEILTVVICILLLALDATVRSAVFALVIAALIHVICLLPFINAAMKPGEEAVVELTDNTEMQDEQDSNTTSRHMLEGSVERSEWPARIPRSTPKPLPPRTR